MAKGQVTSSKNSKGAKKVAKPARVVAAKPKAQAAKPQGAPPSYMNSVIRKPFRAD